MWILNITFSIDKASEMPWVAYVKKNILTKYDDTLLLRIHSNESTHPSYGLQFGFGDASALNNFKTQQLPSVYANLQKEFPNKWVMFETELESIVH